MNGKDAMIGFLCVALALIGVWIVIFSHANQIDNLLERVDRLEAESIVEQIRDYQEQEERGLD